MLAINVMAHEPSGGAAYQHVGGEMLLAKNPCEAHSAGQRVDPELLPMGGVLIRENCGGGPGEHGVR
jgi:hypothetical protein